MTDAGAALATLARSAPHRTDGQLLADFVEHRDGEAFAALVRRLGPRVLAVCRRITGHAHDADDACQAVFLVLARRAAVVTPPEGVAGWVHGVAVRTAQDARAMAARRRSRVTPTAAVPDTPVLTPTPADADQLAALDDEIAKLPERLRAAVVLCELDGVSRKDAANRLGIAEGTLSSRLATARKRLAAALARRGLVLVAVLGLAASTKARGSVLLFASASRWGSIVAAGEPVPAGVPSTLADRWSRIMLLNKLKPLLTASAVGLLALAIGWGTLARLVAADPPKAKAKVAAKPPKPVNKLVIWRQGEAFTLDPDGKNETKLFDLEKFQAISCPVLSPDGKRVAYLANRFDPKDAVLGPRSLYVQLRPLGEDGVMEFNVTGTMLAWSADGKKLMATKVVYDERGQDDPRPEGTTTVIDVATNEHTTAALPEGHIAVGFAPDGEGFVTAHHEVQSEKSVSTACLVSADGKRVKPVSDRHHLFDIPHVSPDGKTLLFIGLKAPVKLSEKPIDANPRLFVQPIGGKGVELADVPLNAELQDCCWSPDGTKIAYTWREILADRAVEGKPDDRETESHLVVCDADGKNAKTILSEKGQGQWRITLSSVCWR